MSYLKIFTLILIIFGATDMSYSSDFKGYKRNPAQSSMHYSGTVDRYTETPEDILILISGKSAFYKFPKSREYANQVLAFIRDRFQKKIKIYIEVDPTTAEVLTIGDAK